MDLNKETNDNVVKKSPVNFSTSYKKIFYKDGKKTILFKVLIVSYVIACILSLIIFINSFSNYVGVKKESDTLHVSLHELEEKLPRASDVYNTLNSYDIPLVLCSVINNDGSVISYIGQDLEKDFGRVIEFIFEDSEDVLSLLTSLSSHNFNIDSIVYNNKKELVLRIHCI